MPLTASRRRRQIEDELDGAMDPARPPEQAPAAEQLLALQRQAGNHAVGRMLSDAWHPQRAAPARQELARRADRDSDLLSALRGAAALRTAALTGPAGSLVGPESGSHPDLQAVGPGLLLGEGDGETESPGPTAPEADAQIATVEGPEDPARAAQNPVATASPDVAPDAAPPTEETAATPETAAPEGGPATAPPVLEIHSRTDMKAPDGSPDTRRKVGMGEVVYFDVGGAVVDWTASAGWPPRRQGRSTYAWELSTPGTATITATDPGTGATATTDIEVVAPDELKMRKESEDPQPAGQAGAGMWLIPRFGPRSVSFGNVEWLEVAGPASGVSGYFLDLQTAGTDLAHHPNPNFLRITAAVRDHAAFLGLPSPYKEGAFHWDIPNSFRRAKTGGAGVTTVTSVQSFHISAAGVVTVTKQGATVTRAP